MKDYAAILGKLLESVSETGDMRARSELHKIYRNCKKIYLELDKESVECRRTRKLTAKYQEIAAKLDESINTFEQWNTFSKLLY